MDQKIDLTLYYQVKAKFPAAPGTVVFISATSDKIEELEGQIFTEAQYSAFYQLVGNHCDEDMPYFAVSNLHPEDHIIYYDCKEIRYKEDYSSGKILSYKRGPFRTGKIDMEKVREELKKLGAMLKRDSQAS